MKKTSIFELRGKASIAQREKLNEISGKINHLLAKENVKLSETLETFVSGNELSILAMSISSHSLNVKFLYDNFDTLELKFIHSFFNILDLKKVRRTKKSEENLLHLFKELKSGSFSWKNNITVCIFEEAFKFLISIAEKNDNCHSSGYYKAALYYCYLNQKKKIASHDNGLASKNEFDDFILACCQDANNGDDLNESD